MKLLYRLCEFAKTFTVLITILAAVIAFAFPGPISTAIPTSTASTLVAVLMFCTVMTSDINDFKLMFKRPKIMILGVVAEYAIMSALAVFLCKIFRLPSELAIGVVLVGCCPGGTASNAMTYIAKGDMTYSVGLTALASLVSPLLTPFLASLLTGDSIEINYLAVAVAIVMLMFIPMAIGFAVKAFLPKVAEIITELLPLISVVIISSIIMSVVAASISTLASCTLALFAVVALHNALGYILGYGTGHLMGLDHAQMRALSLETGMRNSGLGIAIALLSFPTAPLTALPGMVFSVWHNISGLACAKLLVWRHCDS